MPYTIDWLIPDKLLHVIISDPMSRDEFMRMLMDMGEFGREVDLPNHLHHVLMDSRQQKLMLSIADLRHLAQEMKASDAKPVHHSIGWTVVITENKLLRFGASIFSQFLGFRVRIYDTMDGAIAFLREQDATIKSANFTI